MMDITSWDDLANTDMTPVADTYANPVQTDSIDLATFGGDSVATSPGSTDPFDALWGNDFSAGEEWLTQYTANNAGDSTQLADITGTSSDSDLLGTIGKYMNKVSADTWTKIAASAVAGMAKSKAAEKEFQLKEKEYQLKKDKDTRAATSNTNLKLPSGLIGGYSRMTGAKA